MRDSCWARRRTQTLPSSAEYPEKTDEVGKHIARSRCEEYPVGAHPRVAGAVEEVGARRLS